MPEPSNETTVLLHQPVVIPGAAEETTCLTFADSGGHHVDADRVLYIKGRTKDVGNIAVFDAGEWRGAYTGNQVATRGAE